MAEPSSSTAFVGRRSELAAFDRVVDVARLGRPGVLLVAVTPASASRRWSPRVPAVPALTCSSGRSVPMGGEVIPLSPLVELVRNVRRSSPEALNHAWMPRCGPLWNIRAFVECIETSTGLTRRHREE